MHALGSSYHGNVYVKNPGRNSTTVPGCTQAPFSLPLDQPITWAAPWVEFRSDEMTIQFKWLSAREIAPL